MILASCHNFTKEFDVPGIRVMTKVSNPALFVFIGLGIGFVAGYVSQLPPVSEKWIAVVGAIVGAAVGAAGAGLGAFLVKQNEFDYLRKKEKRDLYLGKYEEFIRIVAETKVAVLACVDAVWKIHHERGRLLELGATTTGVAIPSEMSLFLDEYTNKMAVVTEKLSYLEAIQTLYLDDAEDLMETSTECLNNLLTAMLSAMEEPDKPIPLDAVMSINHSFDKLRQFCKQQFTKMTTEGEDISLTKTDR